MLVGRVFVEGWRLTVVKRPGQGLPVHTVRRARRGGSGAELVFWRLGELDPGVQGVRGGGAELVF